MTESPRLALALLNTASGTRDGLAGPADVLGWLRETGFTEVGDEVALRVGEFRALRGAIAAVLHPLGDGPAEEPLRLLNEASAAAPRHDHLGVGNGGELVVTTVEAAGSTTAGILAAIARSAIGLAGGPDGASLRVCPAARCGRSFLAARTAQVWCGPACGNRMRVARHHARRRTGGGPAD